MTVQTIATLKANMPIGVSGGITAQDMHDLIDTLEFLTTEPILSKTASYTAALADERRRIVFTSASAVTLTLPSSLPAGWKCMVIQAGAGAVTVAVTGGSLRSRLSHTKTSGQYAQAFLTVYANTGVAPQVAFSGDTAV